MGLHALKRNLKRLKNYGWKWWQIGRICDRSEGWACAVARGRHVPPEDIVEEIATRLEKAMPEHLLWEGGAVLDSLVLGFLRRNGRLTGRELGRLCGTTDRTIRKSIARLRKKHRIDGSMKPPRGYKIDATPTDP